MSAKRKTAKKQPDAIEPHELAGELTHEQRIKLAEGLGALYRRKVAEDQEHQAAETNATPRP